MRPASISTYPPPPASAPRFTVPKASAKAGKTLFFALAVCLWLVIAVAMITSENMFRGLLTSATAIAIFLPLITTVAKGQFDIFEPIVPATLALTTMFVVRPLADQVLSNYVHLGYNIYPNFDQTLVTVLVSCVAFSAGYLSNIGSSLKRMLPDPGWSFPRKKVVRAAVLTAMLGLTLYGAFIATSGGLATLALFLRGRSKELGDLERHSTGYLYASLNFLVPASFSFFGAWLHFHRRKYLILAGLAATPVIALGTAQGSRSGLLPVVLGLCSIYYLYKQRRPKLKMLLVSGIVILIAFALLREGRNFDYRKQASITQLENSSNAGQDLADTFSSDDNEMFDTLANIISIIPSRLPYDPLAAITDLTSRILPRSLFPNKPMEAIDKTVTTLWPWHYRTSRASAASSIVGGFYVYGGIIGAAIGCFAIGVLFNQTWKWFLRNSRNLNAILLYSFVPAFVVILLRGTTADTLTRMFYLVLPLVLQQRYWRKA